MDKARGRNGMRIALVAMAVLCALLIGYLFGSFGREGRKETPPAGPGNASPRPERPPAAVPEPGEAELDLPRVDLVYEGPDGDAVWNDTYPEVPPGDGVIKGSVLSNGRPLSGLAIALILAPGRKTVTVPLGADGGFTVPIAKGKYNLNALAIYQGAKLLEGQLLLTGLDESEDGGEAGGPDPATVNARFDELSKQYGPQEAARRLAAEEQKGESGAADEFPFTVADPPFVLAPFQYRDLIETVSPVENSEAPLAGLKFIWAPFPSAASYSLEISELLGQGDTATLTPVLARDGIKDNFIDYQTLLAAPPPKEKDDDGSAPAGRLEPGKRYGYSIYAFDEKGKLLSASGDPREDEVIEFRVK